MHEPDVCWKLSTVVKIIGSLNTFSRGMEKLTMAENTSDICTDLDSNVTKLKRRRHAKKILTDDEEESSTDDDKISSTKCLRPFPKVPQKRNKKNSASNSLFQKQMCNTQSNTQKMQETTDIENESLEKYVENTIGSQTNAIENILYDSHVSDDQCRSENEKENISQIMKPVPSCSKALIEQNRQENIDFSFQANEQSKWDTISEERCSSCKVLLNCQKETLNLQKKMLNLLVQINLRGQKILQNITEKLLTNRSMTISDIINDDNDLCPEYLPAQMLADFHAAEEKWKIDKEYRENVLKLFIQCKGGNVKTTTYTIMEKLMSDGVAMQYSWTGAKQNKEKMEESPFRKVLEKIIIQLHSDATLHEIKKCITDWLRHAKERHTRRSNGNHQAE